jgi:thioredoxin 1
MKSHVSGLLPLLFSAVLFLAVFQPQQASAQKIVDNVYLLTDQDFDKFTKSGIVLVDFWAVWCAPCRIQGPIVTEIAQEIGQKAVIAKLDVDAAKITATRYRIQYIPTIIIFKDGVPAKRLTGLQDKEALLNAIDEVAR